MPSAVCGPLEHLESIQKLVHEAVTGLGSSSSGAASVGQTSVPRSWNTLESTGSFSVLVFGGEMQIEVDDDLDDEAVAAGLAAADHDQAVPPTLYSGTRGIMGSVAHVAPMQGWAPAPEPAPPPLRAHVTASEPERYDIADGPATEDPYGTPIGSGRSESSTPRRWLSTAAGAFDDLLSTQAACVLAAVLLSLTPIVRAATYAVAALGFFVVVAWRNFVRLSTALVLTAVAGMSALGWFFDEFEILYWSVFGLVLAMGLWWLYPLRWGGDGELPRAVAQQAGSFWWRAIRFVGRKLISVFRRPAQPVRPLEMSRPQTPCHHPTMLPGAQLAARQALRAPSLASTVGQREPSPMSEAGVSGLATAPIGPANH